MQDIQEFFKALSELVQFFNPVRIVRTFRLGAQRVAEFRDVHHREPTEAEWQAIARKVDEEVSGKNV